MGVALKVFLNYILKSMTESTVTAFYMMFAIVCIICCINKMYSYKVDISNYFNSVPIEKFLLILQESLYDDKRLYFFLNSLLTGSHVIEGNEIISEERE